MLPEKRDAAYLWDMREAARDIVGWVKDVSYEQFCNDEMLHSAVERKLEVFWRGGWTSFRANARDSSRNSVEGH